MSTRDGQWIAIDDLTGGLNTADPPMSLPDTQVVAAFNVEWFRTRCGRKRAGTSAVSVTGFGATEGVSLTRHLPSVDPTTAEWWGMALSTSGTIYRLAAGTAFAGVTLSDTNANTPETYGVSFNGKLFLAYNSAVDRLHVWDGTSVRRVGLATPAAPTVANTGGGASYPAILRYYKVSYIELSGTTVVRRSELSPSVSFTPSGAGDFARITKPAAISEGETHWEVWGSADNVTFFLLFQTVVGTTAVDDGTVPSNYSQGFNGNASLGNAQIGTISPLVGEYTAPGSAKYLLVDEDRLIMAGNWEDTAKSSIVEFTPVGGDKDIADDERVPQTSQRKLRLNVDRRNGGAITGLGGPIYSAPIVFKYDHLYKLVRTGNSTAPYTPITISRTKGAIAQRSICIGEDELGQETLYFMDASGPYRVGANGVQFVGRDLIDVWARMNVSATIPAITLYYADRKQVWWYVAVDGASAPNALYVLDVTKQRPSTEGMRGGWSQFSTVQVSGAFMFANTLGATMSRDLKPHTSISGSVAFRKGNTGLDDAGTDFQAFVTTRPYPLVASSTQGMSAIGVKGGVTGVVVEAEASASATSFDVFLNRDYGAEVRGPKSVSLAPVGTESRVIRPVTDLEMTEAQHLTVVFGDDSATEATWNIDRIGLKLRRESDVL